jgi:hypothetical protein
MRSTGVVRAQATPPSIVPQRGQATEHDSETPRSEHWGVFHKDITGSNLPNDSSHLFPETGSASAESLAGSGATDVLTRKSARYHINRTSPWKAVKGAHVIPYRERLKGAIVLPCEENVSAEGIIFNSAYSPESTEDSSEYASTSAREKCQLIHLPSCSAGDGGWGCHTIVSRKRTLCRALSTPFIVSITQPIP